RVDGDAVPGQLLEQRVAVAGLAQHRQRRQHDGAPAQLLEVRGEEAVVGGGFGGHGGHDSVRHTVMQEAHRCDPAAPTRSRFCVEIEAMNPQSRRRTSISRGVGCRWVPLGVGGRRPGGRGPRGLQAWDPTPSTGARMHRQEPIDAERVRGRVAERIARASTAVVLPLEVEVWEPVAASGVVGQAEPVPVAEALAATYQPFDLGASWGPPWGTTWFHLTGTVPEAERTG